MGGAVYFASGCVNGNIPKLLTGAAAGVITYFVCCAVCKVDEVKYLTNKVKSIVFKK